MPFKTSWDIRSKHFTVHIPERCKFKMNDEVYTPKGVGYIFGLQHNTKRFSHATENRYYVRLNKDGLIWPFYGSHLSFKETRPTYSSKHETTTEPFKTIAEENRQKCNKLTQKERDALFVKGMNLIYGGVNIEDIRVIINGETYKLTK
jgi:hypothetical protein